MSDEQLHLDVTYWQPGDGHGTPLRRVDKPPRPRFPSVFAGINDPAPAQDNPDQRECEVCRTPFLPVIAGQQRCTPHELAYDARQARRHRNQAGPGLSADDVIR
jgi:hypothetical protein